MGQTLVTINLTLERNEHLHLKPTKKSFTQKFKFINVYDFLSPVNQSTNQLLKINQSTKRYKIVNKITFLLSYVKSQWSPAKFGTPLTFIVWAEGFIKFKKISSLCFFFRQIDSHTGLKRYEGW